VFKEVEYPNGSLCEWSWCDRHRPIVLEACRSAAALYVQRQSHEYNNTSQLSAISAKQHNQTQSMTTVSSCFIAAVQTVDHRRVTLFSAWNKRTSAAEIRDWNSPQCAIFIRHQTTTKETVKENVHKMAIKITTIAIKRAIIYAKLQSRQINRQANRNSLTEQGSPFAFHLNTLYSSRRSMLSSLDVCTGGWRPGWANKKSTGHTRSHRIDLRS